MALVNSLNYAQAILLGIYYESTYILGRVEGAEKERLAQEQKQHQAKIEQVKMINLIPGHMPFDRVDIWFQDEARFGQQNTTTQLWAKTGSRPRST